jgi:glycerol-1-phosphate dehydrogenase [NAD(P)+]
MVDFTNSRPASGTEHHYSHFWEMMLLQQGRPPVLHGAKTGVGTIMGARLYAKIRSLTRADVEDLLEAVGPPDTAVEEGRIRSHFGGLAEELIAEQQPFIAPSPAEWEERKRRVLDQWDAVQRIAATVPEPETVAGWLETVGGPTSAAELGFSAAEEASAQGYAHYLRDRFTVRKLVEMLGIQP